MKEIRGLSLFANVGVAEAYMSDIGVNIRVANELLPERAKFYQELYPNVNMICGDITNEGVRKNIIEAAIREKVNFIIATPPCQGMSVAGNRDPLDVRNQLIFYAIDVIKKVKPDYILLENVPRLLVSHIKIGEELKLIPNYIREELVEYYTFNDETKVKAKDYGVPQLRERNIFLLVKRDVGITWTFPIKEKEITLEKAIGHLPELDPMLREGLEYTLDKFPNFLTKKQMGENVSKWHRPPIHSWRQVEWMMHTPTGESATFNKVYYPQKKDGNAIIAHHNHYRRLAWNKPCRTITQNNGVISSLCCVHPGQVYFDENGNSLYSNPRVLSIYELLIVTSLPTNWNIPLWASDTLIRKVIGEGIPPLLIKKTMQELIRKLKRGEADE